VKVSRLLRFDWPLHFVLLVTNWLPDNTPFLALRGWMARHFVRRSGRSLRLGRNVTIYNPSCVEFGHDVYLAYGVWFMAGAAIVVEDEAQIGPYSVIVSSNHRMDGGSFRHSSPEEAPIRIGRGAWLGAHVTVTAGAEIGAGCLIGANSVVLGRIPAHSLAAGCPATVKRPLDALASVQ